MPSPLETFFILFESNADDVKKGADEAEKSTDDLEQSITGVDGAAKKGGQQFVAMAKKVAIAAVSLATLKRGLQGVISSAEESDIIGRFADRYDLATESVDAYGRAVEAAGGSQDALRGSVAGLQQQLVETSIKGTSGILPYLNKFGIAAVDASGKARSAFEILPELAGAFENISKIESAGIGAQLGLDAETILLLQKGREEFEKTIAAQKDAGVLTKEQADSSREFNKELSLTSQAFTTIGRQISAFVLPAFTGFLERCSQIDNVCF